jgi:hypothetical protein
MFLPLFCLGLVGEEGVLEELSLQMRLLYICFMPRKPPKGKSLAEVNPKLAKQWHPTKNGELTPYKFTSGSSNKVWWKCDKGDDHEWATKICHMSNGGGCPICSNRITVLSNCLATLKPELSKDWHPTKNGNLTPFDVTVKSSRKVWWKCDKGDDHEWEASLHKRSQGRNCPVCNGKKVVLSNCLATLNPKLSKEWHPIKNGELSTYDVTGKSGRKVWWKCDKGDDHEWISEIANRVFGNGCPICDGKKIVKSNCLSTTHNWLIKEWHPTKNKILTPENVIAGSSKKVWWKCDKGDDHEWFSQIATRSLRDYGCPFCTLTPQSKQELTITFELIKFFKDINPKGFKTRVNGKLWSIDIYIPQLKLGIEFDGSYWHKDKRALDKLKTEKLEEDGFEIFRVREEPLKRIFEDDIMSKQPFNGKHLTNDILTQIMNRYNLDAKKIAKIKAYIPKKELQNDNGLDKYIDEILTEKAEKNNV